MSIQLIENYADFAFADLSSECAFVGGATGIVDGPRSGSKALSFTSTSHYVEYAIGATSTVRFAIRFKMTGGTGDRSIFTVMEGSTGHVTVGVDASGYLRAWRNGSWYFGTVLGTAASSPLSADIWYQIEGKIVIHDTTGSVEVRLNGDTTPLLNITGADTREGLTGSSSLVRIGAAPNSLCPFMLFTDLVVWDEAGESPTGWVGDVRVDSLAVTGAGSSTDWTPSAGSNYQCVDEANADGDTTYIQSGTDAQKDLFSVADLPHNPSSIHAVVLTAKAKKTDAGSASIKLTIKSGATEAQGSAESLSDGSYVRYKYSRGVDPDTSSAWGTSGVNAIEVGVESVI